MRLTTLSTILLALGLVAASEPPLPSLDLMLEAPPECPSAPHVTSAVDALLRTPPAQPLVVRAKIEHQESDYVLDARLSGGSRRVHGETCDAVIQALIAIAALAIDPTARLSVAGFPELAEEPHEAPAPATSETAPLASAPSPPLVRPRERDVAEPFRKHEPVLVGASMLGLGEWGALPEPSYGASGFLRVSLRAWSAELGGSWLRPRWVQVSGVAERKGGYVSWLSLQGNGCRWLGKSGAACGGVEVGRMTGEGQGVSNEDSGHALWLAAALSALGRVPLGDGLALEARATAAIPFYRPEFSLEPYRALHRASWISGRLSLGIAFR